MDKPLSEGATILLGLIRYANRNNINIRPILPSLRDALRISQEEIFQIGELVKADIREENASSPLFGQINRLMDSMG